MNPFNINNFEWFTSAKAFYIKIFFKIFVMRLIENYYVSYLFTIILLSQFLNYNNLYKKRFVLLL
jgi:hypothetical protein